MVPVEKVTPYQTGQSKKQQVKDMFDNISKTYDFLNHFLSLGIDKLWRKRAIREIKKIQPKRILDIATGTGDFAIEAMVLQPEQVIGVDISEGMLAVGRKKIANYPQIQFEIGDSEQLRFDSCSFDAVTAGFGVRNFENLEKGLSEMARVLKPSGLAVILEPAIPKHFPMNLLFQLYFKGILPIIGKLISQDKSAYQYLPESVSAFPDGNEFIDICKRCGFRTGQWIPLTFGICSMYVLEK